MQLCRVNLSYQRPEHSSAFFANLKFIVISFLVPILFGICSAAEARHEEPRGEIRVVESWRPNINVLGHNVLQYLFEYALDRTNLVPSLAVSRKWIYDTTLEVGLRENIRFHNGKPFEAGAVKFNFEYQREHNPGRGVQVYMKNVREIRVIKPYTVQMVLDQPDAFILERTIIGPVSGWVIGAPRHMEEVGWEGFIKRPVGTGPFTVVGEVFFPLTNPLMGDPMRHPQPLIPN